jgi:hypothetical protein
MSDLTFLTLVGVSDGTGNDLRVNILTTLYNNARAKEGQLESMRQRNTAFALGVFAFLFGFGSRMAEDSNALTVSVALVGTMMLFAALDRRLHMFAHGWRRTAWRLTRRLTDAGNHPHGAVSFKRYYGEAERNAEWFSLQPLIHYILILGSIMSFFAFRY